MYSVDIYQQCYVNLEQEYFIFMNYSDSHSLMELGKKYHYGSDYIKQNYEKAKELYELAVRNKDYVANIYLGVLHMDMKKTHEAIEYFLKAIEKGYFQCFINLGDIYFYEKDYMDIDLAEQYYTAAIRYSTSNTYKILAQDKLNTLKIEKKDDYYNKQTMDIDTLMKYDIHDHIDEIVQNQKPVPAFNEVLNDVDEHTHLEKEVRRNDPQNVHDHVVSNTVMISINKLIKHTEIIMDKTEVLKDIRNFIKEQEEHQDIALNVLDHIEIDSTKFRDTNLQQVDILYYVWNRIYNDCNKDVRDKLKENLYQRLLECIEYDSNVCASGIFSRLIDTLNFQDSENLVQIIPKYALNKELMNKASIISRKFEEEQPKDVKDLLRKSKLTDDEQKIVEQYSERLKQKLIAEFRKDYIDSNMISEDILFLEINKWLNDI